MELWRARQDSNLRFNGTRRKPSDRLGPRRPFLLEIAGFSSGCRGLRPTRTDSAGRGNRVQTAYTPWSGAAASGAPASTSGMRPAPAGSFVQPFTRISMAPDEHVEDGDPVSDLCPQVSPLRESLRWQRQAPPRRVRSARRAPAARQRRGERRRWRATWPRGRRARPARHCWRAAPDARERRAPKGRPQLEARREKTQPPFWPGRPSHGRLHCSSAASARANCDGSLGRTTRREGSRACSYPNGGRCVTARSERGAWTMWSGSSGLAVPREGQGHEAGGQLHCVARSSRQGLLQGRPSGRTACGECDEGAS